jgi:hypothetical protein
VAAWLAKVLGVIGAEGFEATEVACSLAANQVVLSLRWRSPITRTRATSTSPCGAIASS